MNPTDEQIKEFWEWCGFKKQRGDLWEGYTLYGQYYEYPDGQYHPKLPPIDLNNLFKYAVPKLQGKEWLISLRTHEHNGFDALLEFIPKDLPLVRTDNIDPALALFWVIWKVIKNES